MDQRKIEEAGDGCRPVQLIHVEDVFKLVYDCTSAQRHAISHSHAKTGATMKAKMEEARAEFREKWLALGLPNLDWSERD